MVVYKIVNIVNNKLYFGVTKCDLKKRWNEHKCKSRSGKSHLYCSIRKYGIDNFIIEEVFKCNTESEMYELEVDMIKKYQTNNPLFGYNNSIGGEVSSKGKKLSKETKSIISKFQKERVRNPHSKETKDKMSKSAKGRDMSIAIKNSAIKRKGQKAHNICKVSKYTLNNVFLEEFNSLTDAAKNVNGCVSAFGALRIGRLKTYKKFIWKF